MMDANNIQVKVFYIYSPRKPFERKEKVWFTRNSMLFDTVYSEEYVQLKNKNSKAVEQGFYLCFKTLYKYV